LYQCRLATHGVFDTSLISNLNKSIFIPPDKKPQQVVGLFFDDETCNVPDTEEWISCCQDINDSKASTNNILFSDNKYFQNEGSHALSGSAQNRKTLCLLWREFNALQPLCSGDRTQPKIPFSQLSQWHMLKLALQLKAINTRQIEQMYQYSQQQQQQQQERRSHYGRPHQITKKESKDDNGLSFREFVQFYTSVSAHIKMQEYLSDYCI